MKITLGSDSSYEAIGPDFVTKYGNQTTTICFPEGFPKHLALSATIEVAKSHFEDRPSWIDGQPEKLVVALCQAFSSENLGANTKPINWKNED